MAYATISCPQRVEPSEAKQSQAQQDCVALVCCGRNTVKVLAPLQ